MSIQTLLSRLDKVKPCGRGRWKALCPSHVEKTPSLMVKEGTDGTILVHCFGQNCGIEAIVESVGMTISDLFPASDKHVRRNGFHATDVLLTIGHKAFIVAAIATDVANKGTCTQQDRDNLIECAAIISGAMKMANIDIARAFR